MSYDDWKARVPDDDPEGEHQDEPERPTHGGGWCECHCDRCGAALELDPFFGQFYAQCGDCHGGQEPDGEAFRGGEAAAYERDRQAEIQRTLK